MGHYLEATVRKFDAEVVLEGTAVAQQQANDFDVGEANENLNQRLF